MRAAAYSFLALLLADVTPRSPEWVEARWHPGDFIAASNESLERVVDSGDAVGIKLSGRQESCLLRARVYPLRTPCRLRFRVRSSEAQFGHWYPSLHVLFNPPALDDPWWKQPIEDRGWTGRRPSFLFHFSSDPTWRLLGMTRGLEDAAHRHGYSAQDKTWVQIEIRFDGRKAAVFADGLNVAECSADLREFKTFTYGIGDQTSTFVELDEFRCEPAR
ncbi:MAG TPA: hypothetical protein VFS19_03350 [Planctomycetota bacterium]|nr:hypothetical protein [Planctomycetota bacterium]